MRLLICLLSSLLCHAGNTEVLNIKANDFTEIAAYYQNFTTDTDKTLLVFDIDDTLLTMSQPLGGVACWDWQSDLLKNHPDSKKLFAHTFKELVKDQNLLFQLIKMDVTDDAVLPFIKLATERGASLMALTARGSEHLNVTLTQLEVNGFVDNENQLLFKTKGLQLTTKKTSRSGGLNCEQFTHYVEYYQGIVFLNGEDKGVALQCLLKRSAKEYNTILFVDDVKHNVDSVEKVFSNQSNVRVLNVLYTHEQYKEQLFLNSPNLQEEAYSQWENILKIFKENINKSNF